MFSRTLALVPAFVLVAAVAAFSQPADAQVDVKVTLNQCPTIDQFIAGPLDLYLGGDAEFKVVAKDKDKNPLSYIWTVRDTASNETRLLTSKLNQTTVKFRCERKGAFHVTLLVSDGHCEAAYQDAEVRCYNLDE